MPGDIEIGHLFIRLQAPSPSQSLRVGTKQRNFLTDCVDLGSPTDPHSEANSQGQRSGPLLEVPGLKGTPVCDLSTITQSSRGHITSEAPHKPIVVPTCLLLTTFARLYWFCDANFVQRGFADEIR